MKRVFDRKGMRMGKRIVVSVAFFLLLLILAAGCGQNEPIGAHKITTIEVKKDGTLDYYLVDTFEKDYYELAGLTDLAKEEVATFKESNRSLGTDPVRVTSVEMVEGAKDLVSVNYRFTDGKCFEKFYNCLFYDGTVGEALEQKIKMLSGYRSVKDNSVVAEVTVRQMKGSRLIITDQKCVVYCEEKPYCVSEGVIVQEDGGLDLSESKGNAYIIFK